MNPVRDKLAEEKYQHKPDCSCKGSHINEDKVTGFKDGWDACEQENGFAQKWLASQQNAEQLLEAVKKLGGIINDLEGALKQIRTEDLHQIRCPDGIAGCAVNHRERGKLGKIAHEALMKAGRNE